VCQKGARRATVGQRETGRRQPTEHFKLEAIACGVAEECLKPEAQQVAANLAGRGKGHFVTSVPGEPRIKEVASHK
jgi:hypothetical protein